MPLELEQVNLRIFPDQIRETLHINKISIVFMAKITYVHNIYEIPKNSLTKPLHQNEIHFNCYFLAVQNPTHPTFIKVEV